VSQTGSASGAVTSRDGTVVAYDVQGDGPPVVLVAAALSDRGDMKRMSAALSPRFRVINYDRRGRGESGDADAYSTDREIEDIAALIGMAGEPAFLFGSSSGAILALEAASALGNEVRGIAMYEPPLMLNGGRSPVPSSLRSDVRQLLADGRRGAAVRAFMRHALGIPSIGVVVMSLLPSWGKMTRMAHTILYDLTIMDGLQAGQPIPRSRWATRPASPTLILTGGKSEPFFHDGASALAERLANAEHRVLDGQHHGSAVMNPTVIATEVMTYFAA